MTRSFRLGIALATCGLIAAIFAAGTAPAAPTASASRACNLSFEQQQNFPPAAYVNPLKVRNTTCRKGKKVVRAYHRCRAAHGGKKGRCPNRVLRFRCREGDRTSSPDQYYATVVCRRGARKVVHTYTQNK